MNKKITLFLCGALTAGSALAYTHQLDSIVRTTSDGTSKFEPICDTQMQTIGYTHYVRNGNVWTNYARTEIQGSESDTIIITYRWDDGAWAETTKEITTYNAEKQPVRHAIQQKSGSVWLDSITTNYGYDTDGRLASKENAQVRNGTLYHTTKAEYQYTENTITTLNYTWNSAWKAANRTIDTYTDGQLTQSVYQFYDNSWQTSYKYEYTYAANAMSEKRYNYDDTSEPAWTLATEKNYVLNDAGLETGYCYTVFGIKKDSTTHTYTAHGDLENYAQYAPDNWSQTLDETYQHSDIATDDCIGAAFAQRHITQTGAHTYAIATFTRSENGTQTCRDIYYMHSLLPTSTPDIARTADNLFAHDGRIFGNEPMRIYTPSGLDVTAQNGSLCGIYIVKMGDKATKIVVR